MNEQDFKKVISGESHGIAAACLRALLRAASWLYAAAILLRNMLYDGGLRSQFHVSVPVIAVGNITTGGTGKTPVVAWVVQQLQQMGLRPGIVSRGYGADDSGTNDEKRVLEIVCPGVPHQQNPDRVAAAGTLIAEHKVDVIVCDDAFQHRRIARDLNVVLVDATNPFGYGHLLPRGLLREPISSLRRADVVLITRSDAVEQSVVAMIRAEIEAVLPEASDRIGTLVFRPTHLIGTDGQRSRCDSIAGQSVAVVTGIGNPDAFVATCESLGVNVAARKFFPDHHLYSADDLQTIQAMAADAETPLILTTLKDVVKMPGVQANILAVEIETQFVHPEQQQRVVSLLKRTTAGSDSADRSLPAED